MTPAQKAGFVIGTQYRIARGRDKGTVVTFQMDDGSTCPRFTVPHDYSNDGWAFITLDRLEPLEEVKATNLFNYIIDVAGAETTIKVGKILGADQIKRIIEVMGE